MSKKVSESATVCDDIVIEVLWYCKADVSGNPYDKICKTFMSAVIRSMGFFCFFCEAIKNVICTETMHIFKCSISWRTMVSAILWYITLLNTQAITLGN